ncbi:methyl-accepting chemotaxis protein [Shewanella polaris]|nr:methyl-accepting chemotaxis protein [Shewanella polaris]
MNLGLYLKISQRIFLLAMIAISGFIVLFIYQQNLISKTQSSITLLQQEYNPMLKQLNEAKEGLINLEKNLESAVTTGDGSLIDDANLMADNLRKVITSVEEGTKKLNLNFDYVTPYNLYTSNKIFAAKSMLTDDIDFDVITVKTKVASDSILLLQKRIDKAIDSVNFHSDATVDSIFKMNKNSLVIEMSLGGALIILIFGVSFVISRNIVNSLQQVTLSMRDIVEGEGDLTQRVKYSGKDEIADLVFWFNKFIATMQQSINYTQQTISILEVVSEKLAKTSQKSLSLSESQDTAMHSVSESIQELTHGITDIADRASNASSEAASANESAHEGSEIVINTVHSIDQLSKDVNAAAGMVNEFESLANNAGAILNTISGIADQTNLLALNAAIEAARAGEYGRGFSVVADEVRALASRTQNSTAEIKKVLEEIQSGAASVIGAMEAGQKSASVTVIESEKAGQSLLEITNKFDSILNLNKMIAVATDDQRQTYRHMSEKITDMDQISSSVQGGAKDIFVVSEEIQEVTKKLNNAIRQYKV